jgi:selenide,water dikinase
MSIETQTSEIKLTQFSHGAGCGCKIAPTVLEEILKNNAVLAGNKALLVGNDTKDDAAVYDLGNGTALISTTDFFMPIVDDAFDFGRIASANAISDVYAMGGTPLLAIAILGWPVNKLPSALANEVIRGSRAICDEAGIPLAGGHSIDSTEPIFGLAVSGLISISDLKRNNTAKEGDMIFLTKPLGTGILSTAQKRGVLKEEHSGVLTGQMTMLNKIGPLAAKIPEVSAMTDVTGFGLLGHLIEMAEGSGLSAELYYDAVKVMPGVKEYLKDRITPDATFRNWNSYSAKVQFGDGVDVLEAFSLLPDPQTNGGLLMAVAESGVDKLAALFRRNGLADFCMPIGKLRATNDKVINVRK